MANFAINASDDLIKRGKDLIESLTNPGEKQEVALKRIFDIVDQHKEESALIEGGVDAQALDASFDIIRNMFLTAVSGKKQIALDYKSKITALKEAKEKEVADCKAEIAKMKSDLNDALKSLGDAEKEASNARQAMDAEKSRAETSEKLVKEQEKTIANMAEKLTQALEKAEGYDTLLEEQKDACRTIERMKIGFEAEKEKMLLEQEHTLSKMLQERELKETQILAQKEKEMSDAFREYEKKIAQLQAEVAILQNRKLII